MAGLAHWRLGDLHPEWIAGAPGRHGQGLSVLCAKHHPAHVGGEGHRLEIWFSNPCDGGTPFPASQRAWRYGDGLDDLTLCLDTPGVGVALDYGPHGRFWVLEGELLLANGPDSGGLHPD